MELEPMQPIQLFISWIILILGIGLLIFSPKFIYTKIKELTGGELKNLTDEKISVIIDKKLTDKKMLLYYYVIVGITIIIVGLLLILIFSNKIPFQVT